jgi:hypothetical protein
MATGLSLSTTSNLTSGQAIMIDRARVAFEPASPEPETIAMKQLPTGHYQFSSNIYARLSNADALTEGVDLSSVQQFVANNITINPSEHGLLVTQSKRLRRRQGDSDAASTAGTLMGISIRARQALDIHAVWDTFSKFTPGDSTALDITEYRGSVAYLITDNSSAYGPAPMPLTSVLHAEQISDIILDISDPVSQTTPTASWSRNGLSAEMLQRWWRGSDRLYGIPILHGGYIARDTSDDAKGAIYARDSMVMVEEGQAEATEEDDNSLRVIEMGLFKSWGETLQIDVHGVEIYSDAVATV